MSAYRYVVFPHGAKPSAEEMAALRRYADHLNNHIALGIHRRDAGLALAFEAEPFDRLRGFEPAFDDLLTHWQARGGEVVDKLPFVKDSKPWKSVEKPPKAPPPPPTQHHVPADRPHRELSEARTDARELEGRSRLAAARIAAQAERLERAAGWLPYAFWGLGAALVLVAGGYIGSRLLGSESETRADAVQRIADDPIGQSLAPASDSTE